MNKQELIETLSNNRRALGFDAERYNMHMPIGPYTLSVSVGDGMYSTPRQGGFEPDGYTAVEAAILDSDGALMSVNQISKKFGTGCAKLCESYGMVVGPRADGMQWADMCTVMPYITWEQVVFVASMIELHSPSAKDLI
jgi:hypothetical protein